jgi:hypothetical protein
MLVESFGVELPSYIPTIVTFIVVGYSFYKSRRLLIPDKPKNNAEPAKTSRWTQLRRSLIV